MKVKFLVIPTLMLLAGCSQDSVNTFVEGKDWSVNYTLISVNKGTDETYEIIRNDKNMNVNKIHIDMNKGDRTFNSEGKPLQLELDDDNKFTFQAKCEDCRFKSTPKEVTIEWDGHTETIELPNGETNTSSNR